MMVILPRFAGHVENVEGKALDIGLNFCTLEFLTDDNRFVLKTLEEIIQRLERYEAE